MERPIRWHPSPNFGDRREGYKPEHIVIHYTAMRSCAESLDRLCDPAFEVSAHYVISEQGDILQLVDEAKRAWHAGGGRWRGRPDINTRSVGIELCNTGKTPFAAAQMDALEELMPDIMARWSIPDHGVLGHSDMAPSRKNDPGRRFDWRRLALQGLSIWPEADAAPSDTDFVISAGAFGYHLDHGEAAILSAFRQRFRPMVTPHANAPDATDRALMANLALRFGIDRTSPTA